MRQVRGVAGTRWRAARLWRAPIRRLLRGPAYWWHEAIIFFAGVALYSRVQDSLPSHPTGARSRGRRSGTPKGGCTCTSSGG